MRILGIETTCDETGAAIAEDGRKILSNVVASSADLQKKYGGVVPEVAAREQVRAIIPVIEEAIANAAQIRNPNIDLPAGKAGIRNNLSNSKITKWAKENIDAVAVAHGPGLIGSLLIGVETAKTLALVWDKPLIPVNHLVGHVYSNWLESNPKSEYRNPKLPKFPILALIVSGGHTDLVLITGHGKFKLLGSTLDDAAGEAFDKVAKLLGLGYPGGPEVERCAQQMTKDKGQLTFKFPRPMIGSKDFDFSFSGLKTAVVNLVHSLQYSSSPSTEAQGKLKREVTDKNTIVTKDSSHSVRTINHDFKSRIAYEFQQAAVDVLVTKTIRAAEKFNVKSIVVGGGVAANEVLRSELVDRSRKQRIPVFFPQKDLSVDNGAMIAAAAFFNFKKADPLKLSASPSLHFK